MKKPQLGSWGFLRNSDEAELSHARTPVQSDEIRPQHFRRFTGSEVADRGLGLGVASISLSIEYLSHHRLSLSASHKCKFIIWLHIPLTVFDTGRCRSSLEVRPGLSE